MTRSFIRSSNWGQATAAQATAALREALDADGAVDVFDEVEGAPMLAFTVSVHARGLAFLARSPDGLHLATTADSVAAVRSAFAALDRAAEQRRLTRPRRRSAREAIE